MKFSIIQFIISLSTLVLLGCTTKSNSSVDENKEKKLPHLVFLGDSLTAGMGLKSIEESYANLLHARLKKDGYDYILVNAGVSGDTSSGGLTRVKWVISKGVDVFVLELGANDMMRGINPQIVYENLKKIILIVRDKNPDVKILIIPIKTFPNLGNEYGRRFEPIYEKLSYEFNVKKSKFLLEGVAGNKDLNQKDGIHPTSEGHTIMFENIYPDLLTLLRSKG